MWISLMILVSAIAPFITERLRVDVVAFSVVVILMTCVVLRGERIVLFS